MKAHVKIVLTPLVIAVATWLTSQVGSAQALDPDVQTKVDALTKEAQTWAANPAIVDAVKAHNTGLTPDQKAMTEAKWATTPATDPLVTDLSSNPAAVFLKARQSNIATKMFVSGADGTKVAFLAKTSNWNHKGMPKHDVPMTGKTWQGPVQTDPKSGAQSIQIAVPVLAGTTPIGSLVVGLDVSQLKGL